MYRKICHFNKYKSIANALYIEREKHSNNIAILRASVLNGSATDNDLQLERAKFYDVCRKLKTIYFKTRIGSITEMQRLAKMWTRSQNWFKSVYSNI